MNVRLSVPRTLMMIGVLLLMLLASTIPPTQARPIAPAAPDVALRAAPTATPQPEVTYRPIETPAADVSETSTDTEGQMSPTDDSSLTTDPKQGFVTLDVDVQGSFKAGDVITYTYLYVNESETQTASGVAMDVTWSRFDTRIKEDGQYCYPDPESCSITNFLGPTVEIDPTAGLDEDVADGLRVLIGDLAPGESGEFSILVRTGFDLAPVSGRPINQLDSSGGLYVNFVAGASQTLSEASTSSIAVGPRFVISKRAALDMPDRIFAGDEYLFIVTVGNTTAERDKNAQNQPFADAIDATNVLVRDVLPRGSVFITPTQGYDYDFLYNADEGYVEWYIPELALEQGIELPVRFRKLDNTEDCGSLNNSELFVTSDELPINDDNEQLVITGGGANVRVVTPLEVRAEQNPNDIKVGETTQATFTVLNRYNRTAPNGALQNVQLVYQIPETLSYIPDSAQPAPSKTDIIPGEAGGIITWTFDINIAQNTDEPTEQSFTLALEGATPGNPDDSFLILELNEVEPAIPTACVRGLENVGARVISELIPLEVTKSMPRELNPTVGFESPEPDARALIKDGDIVTYTILLESPQAISNLEITDRFPSGPDVRFENVIISDDTPAPIFADDGLSMIWEGINLEANQPISLTYQARIGGGEYVEYCNVARVTLAPADVQVPGDERACYEIRPEIVVEKESSANFALPGETVAFTLTLTNNWDQSYSVELVDRMLGDLVFVDATAPQLGEENYNEANNEINWGVYTLTPGESVQAFVTARIPEGVERQTLRNDVLYRYLYTPLDEWRDCPGNRRASVDVLRPSTDNTVEYRHDADREFTGLQETFEYRILLKNRHGLATMDGITVEHVLPAGFTYDGMVTGNNRIDSDPDVDDTSRADGRVVLRWNVSLDAEQEAEVRFRARAGATVGAKESWLYVSPAGSAESFCAGGEARCRPDGASTARIEIRALHTLQPRAVEPLPGCLEFAEELTYRTSFVNNSPSTYIDTTLSITLPTSLEYTGEYAGVEVPPTLTERPEGDLITIGGLTVPPGQRDIDVKLRVAELDSFFIIQVAADSPTGIIPPENQTGNFLIDPCAAGRLYLPLVSR
jgi:hypothetical protein